MALIRCPECGRDVSNAAGRCIHCGYPLRGRSKRRVPVVLVFLVAAVLALAAVCGQMFKGKHGPALSLPYGLDGSMTPKQLHERMQRSGFVPDFETAEGSRIEFVYAAKQVHGHEAYMTLLSTGGGSTEVAHLYREEASYGTKTLSPLFISLREMLVQEYGLPTHEAMGECSWENGPYALRLYYVGETGGNLWLDVVYQP